MRAPVKVPVILSRLLILLSLFFCLFPASALDFDSDAPISIEADQARLDDTSGTATYTGNVVVRQADATLWADKVILFRENEQLSRVEAYGDRAHYHKEATPEDPETDAWARTIIYTESDKRLTLKTNALVTQGGDRFSGDVIHYDTETELVTASGNEQERVEMTIQPNREKSSDSAQEGSSDAGSQRP